MPTARLHGRWGDRSTNIWPADWGGLILNVAGKVTANYWLEHVPAGRGRAHREADLHIHDLDMLSGYCAGWSLRTPAARA